MSQILTKFIHEQISQNQLEKDISILRERAEQTFIEIALAVYATANMEPKLFWKLYPLESTTNISTS